MARHVLLAGVATNSNSTNTSSIGRLHRVANAAAVHSTERQLTSRNAVCEPGGKVEAGEPESKRLTNLR